MSRLVIPRRTFLRGASGVSLALPLLSRLGCAPEEQRKIEKVGSAQQRAGAFPKRFIFVYTPNGNYEKPTADFSGYWSTLLPLKEKINILVGLYLGLYLILIGAGILAFGLGGWIREARAQRRAREIVDAR